MRLGSERKTEHEEADRKRGRLKTKEGGELGREGMAFFFI